MNESFIEGPFIAESDGGYKLEPNAWGGRFPWQVRVKPINPIVRINAHVFHKDYGMPYSAMVYFSFNIPDDKGKKLIEELGLVLSNSKNTNDSIEINRDINIRLSWTAHFIRCDDGHYVRSRGEAIIDNWLFHNRIAHGYERRLPIEGNVYCDFFIRNVTGEYVYIEYWGLAGSDDYDERRTIKEKYYKENNFKLLSIENKDIDDIDTVLPQKLRQLGINLS